MAKKNKQTKPPVAQKPLEIDPAENIRKVYRLQILVIFLTTFLLYGNTLWNGYAVDDTIVIVKNNLTKQGFDGISEIMKTDAFYGFFGDDYKFVAGGRYRPLSIVTFAIEYELFGLNPAVSHFNNIWLYGLTCIMVFIVLANLFKTEKLKEFQLTIPFIAAMIFAAHPIHTEVVANIKGRDEIMGMLGAVLTLWASIKFVDTDKKQFLIATVVFWLLALFSKENAITFLAIVPLTLYFFKKPNVRQYATLAVLLLIPAAIYLLVRKDVTGVDINQNSTEILNNPFVHASLAEQYATVAFTFGEYIRLLIFPHPLTYDYYYNQVPIIGWSSPKAIIPFFINLAILGYGLYGLKTKNKIAYGILFYFITLSIVSNILFTVGIAMNERFVFMPSMGVSIIFAILLVKLTNYIKDKDTSYNKIKNPPVLIGMLALMMVGYTVKTITRNMDWKNDFTLFAADVQNSPNSAKGLNAYGGELTTAADTAGTPERRTQYLLEADKVLSRALKIYPEYVNAQLLLANAKYKLDKKGNFAIADSLYRETIKRRPFYFEGNYNLGMIYMRRASDQSTDAQQRMAAGKISQAEYQQLMSRSAADYKTAIPYLEVARNAKPEKLEVYYNLADAYAHGGRPQDAIKAYEDIARLQPGKSDPIYRIGTTYGRVMNDLPNAIIWLKKALEMDPSNTLYYEDLGVAYGMSKDIPKAIETFERGLKIDPNYAAFYRNLVSSYYQLGDTAKQQYYMQKLQQVQGQ